jgi:3-oxoacyl-[acyl-carrier-protein] synthase III
MSRRSLDANAERALHPHQLHREQRANPRRGEDALDVGQGHARHVPAATAPSAACGSTSFERSVFNHHRLGHMSSSDPFIGLCDVRDGGKPADGDLIPLVTSGFGFSWDATTLRYKPLRG